MGEELLTHSRERGELKELKDIKKIYVLRKAHCSMGDNSQKLET